MAAETQTQSRDQILVRTIQEVIAGQTDDRQLAEVLAESSKAINATEADFTQAAETMSPQVKEAVRTLVDSAHGFFEQIRIALGWGQDYLKNGDKNLLYNTADTVLRCTNQLDLLFINLRNTAWSLQGPTEIANLNAMIWAHNFYVKDQTNFHSLRELADAERVTMPSAILEISRGGQTPEILALREAFEEHGECATRLLTAIDAGDATKVGQQIELIKATFARIKELIPAANIAQREAGPTRSPQVNIVIGLTDDLLAQKVQDIVLMQALDVLYRDFVESKTYFEQMNNSAADSVLLNEEIAQAKASIALQELALRDYSEFFQDREMRVLKRARDRLQESAVQLWECYEELQAIADREGKTLCIRCSHYNPAQRSKCEKCGMALPMMISGGSSSTFEAQEGSELLRRPITEGPVLTSNLVRVYAAVDKIAEELISDEEYLVEITWFENLIRSNSNYVNQEPDLDSLGEEEREAAELQLQLMDEIDFCFKEALGEFTEAIEAFRRYPETRSRGDLEDGVRLCNSAAMKMLAVRDATKSKG